MKMTSFMKSINKIDDSLKNIDNPEYIEYLLSLKKILEGIEVTTIIMEQTMREIEGKNEIELS